MLINSQLVKDHFGQYYKIQTSKDKPAPLSLEAEIFRSNTQAAQFINNLVAPVSFWSKLLNSETLILKSISNEKQLKEAVAELFSRGKIKAFRVDIPSLSQHAPEKRSVKDSNKNTHTFVPASSLLITNPSEVKKFTDTTEATKYLKELSPNRVELQNLTKELDLPVTSADDEFAELLDLVAKGLAGGSIVVVVDRFSAPPSSGAEAGGAVHGDKDASKGPETPQCTFDVMTVECSHFAKGRNYKLDVIKDKPNLNGCDKALQVIARPGEPDEVTVTYSGSCANNSKECPSIKVSSDTLNGTFIENPYKFNALPLEDEREPGDFIDFLKHYLVPDLSGLKYQVYTIEKAGCNGNEGNVAKIHAFPTFKWGGNVEFGYIQKDGSKEKNVNTAQEKSQLKLASKINGNVGSKDWAFETSNSKDTKDFFPKIFETVDGLVKRVDEFAAMSDPDAKNGADANIGLVKLNVGWPNISLGGNIELKEAADDFDVDVGGDISLSFAPLIKAELRTDILDWFVSITGGPFGEFLRRVKIQAAKGVGTKNFNAKAIVALEIVMSGSLSADLKWEKNAKEKWLSTAGDKTGSASLGLTIGLVGVIKGETQIFRVKVTIGAELHLKGAKSPADGIGGIVTLFSTTAKGKPALGGKFEFTGAALYYTYYAEVGSAEVESTNSATSSSGRRSSARTEAAVAPSKTETSFKEKELEKLHEFFAPFTIPSENKDNKSAPLGDIEL